MIGSLGRTLRRNYFDPVTYGMAIGRIRVLEGKLLSRQRLERLIEAETPAEQVRILAETEFGRIFESIENLSDVERGLERHLERVYRFLDECCPQSWLERFFRLRYDFHNMRVHLKAKARGEVPSRRGDGFLWERLGLLPLSELDTAAETDGWQELPEPYGQAAAQALERYEDTGELLDIDTVLDAALYEELGEIARAQRNDFLERLVRVMVDLANLKAFLRGRVLDLGGEDLERALMHGGALTPEQLLEAYPQPLAALVELTERAVYGEAVAQVVAGERPDLKLWDKLAADVLARLIEEARRKAVGPEPVIAYIWNREQETGALRAALAGKLAGLPPVRIEERVRSFYGWTGAGL